MQDSPGTHRTAQEGRGGWRAYLDAPLIAFVLLMVAAATITAHGTLTFYLYILPAFWAWAAMLTIGAGIPLLELAAVLDKANRWRYVLGMVVLLGMEGLAQYFQGQATFVPKVLASFPNPVGVDLATFAQEPRGRLLAVAYLAMPSLIVVYFGYAASARVRDIRAGLAQRACPDCAEHVQYIADLTQTLEERDAALRAHELQHAHFDAHMTRAAAAVRERDDAISDRDAELARLRQQAAQPLRIDKALIVSEYRRLRTQYDSARKAAQELDISEATLRSWDSEAEQAARNGHAQEVEA